MAQPAKILVVDDNAENRALAEATLEDEGYDVLLASSGQQALTLFDEHGADCILLDVRMPKMDGFEVARRLRERPAGGQTGIVFLTALRDVDTFDQAQLAGGDDFLTKPVRPAELVSRVEAVLKLSQLSAEVREQNAVIRKQRDDLIRLQLLKERLAAFVVHDLKNPVGSLDLQAQVLLRDKSLSSDAKAAVARMRSEARRLSRLIANLLDLSKADEGALEPQKVSVRLGAVIDEVFDDQRLHADANDVRLQAAVDAPETLADADMLRRVLVNLIDNAIRHAPRQSAVHVTTSRADAGVEIRVSDSGPGIPESLRERIFEPHVRAEEERHSSRTGHGLGLAYCRAAVSSHGGRIAIEPTETGTTFCIRLPHE